jgi:hypothetical protein
VRSQSAENTSKVLLTLIRAAGVEADSYGVAEGEATETVAEIEG